MLKHSLTSSTFSFQSKLIEESLLIEKIRLVLMRFYRAVSGRLLTVIGKTITSINAYQRQLLG
ncbi:hypothetical protein AKJ31_16560 [Vibrio hepatarius]|uniref:Uncharacterized protein n=1 Tax=Vibrio hepatarius TaxID=171383 RepID=A0A0M0HX96_9VIBR|nr:hypothetical protein AKJ31_16560 [Vibrio hepatarius]